MEYRPRIGNAGPRFIEVRVNAGHNEGDPVRPRTGAVLFYASGMSLYDGPPVRNAAVSLTSVDLAALRCALETADITEHQKTWCERAQTDDAILFFGVTDHDRLVGQMMLHDIDADRVSLVGYHVFKAGDRGRGTGSLALEALCRHAFDAMGILRLVAITGIENHASQRIATKCGFTNKGQAREGPHKVVFERLR